MGTDNISAKKTDTASDSPETSASAKVILYCLRAIAMLPLGALYMVSNFAYFILYRVVGYRRKVVSDNLKLAFPEKSDKERAAIEKEFYHHLCDVFIEALKLLHISDRQLNNHIEVVNAELVDDAYRRNHSVVLFLGHYGNWEWVSDIVRYFKTPIKTGQVYHPLSNKVMDQVMLRIRSHFKSENIPMARTVRHLLQIEKEGGHFIVGFIADQRPAEKILKHWTTFFGIETPYIIGAETIGQHVDAEYLYIDIEKERRGHYKLTFKPIEPPADDKEDFPYTREYLRMLEGTIRRSPAYWLWSHKRWSRRKETEPKG